MIYGPYHVTLANRDKGYFVVLVKLIKNCDMELVILNRLINSKEK